MCVQLFDLQTPYNSFLELALMHEKWNTCNNIIFAPDFWLKPLIRTDRYLPFELSDPNIFSQLDKFFLHRDRNTLKRGMTRPYLMLDRTFINHRKMNQKNKILS